MRTRRTHRRTIATVGTSSLAAGLLLVTLGTVLSPAGADSAPKVTICHATSSTSNPYVEISVSQSAVDGDGQNDHTHHTGPLFDFADPGANESWGDIIPHVGAFAGMNWSPEGQGVLANGCAAPAAPVDPDPCTSNPELTADDPTCEPPVDPDPCTSNPELTADDPTCEAPVDPPDESSTPDGTLGASATPDQPASAPLAPSAIPTGALPRTGGTPLPAAAGAASLILLGGAALIGRRRMFPKRTGAHFAA